jgi:putative aminopeptidase FrvX
MFFSQLLLLLSTLFLQSPPPLPPVDLQPKTVIEQRLKRYGGNDLKREAALKQMFADAGCADLTEQPVRGLKEPNVICVMKGSADRTIIIAGAHYDHVDRGSGVVDNWSGASLLPSLMQSLKVEPRRHTYIFIGFSGEEQGEIGSHFYVQNLAPADATRVQAMVNLDTLGLGPTEVWASRADPLLVRMLAGVARDLSLPVTGMNVEKVGSTDSEQFRAKNIPAITIHSLTQKTLPVLHSIHDQIGEIRMNDYYDTYRLVSSYLAYLDKLPIATEGRPAQ